MSANIPSEIQEEIIKRVVLVKSLIRFRSVSKQWKSLINSSEFITHHSANQTQPHHLLITYKVDSENKYVSIVDDDNFHHHKFSSTIPPTFKPARDTLMIGCSNGLVCMYGFNRDDKKKLIVLWNPSIRKSVGIALPCGSYVVGFGVCPETSDPKIVKITRPFELQNTGCQAAVFTLSSMAWRSVSMNLHYTSIKFSYHQVIIDGVIHWVAYDFIARKDRIISFNLTSEEFGEVDLPDSLDGFTILSISKLNESLVVLNYYLGDAGKEFRDVWMMLKNGVPKPSFTKLYAFTAQSSYGAPHYMQITGFRKNGQPIIVQLHSRDSCSLKELEVCEPYSEHISGLGIYGSSFMMTSYTESLLLLNHSNSFIQC